MYDWPAHRSSANHISIAAIWDICSLRQLIESNARTIDDAIAFILDDKREDHLATDPDMANKYAAALPAPDDIESRENGPKDDQHIERSSSMVGHNPR